MAKKKGEVITSEIVKQGGKSMPKARRALTKRQQQIKSGGEADTGQRLRRITNLLRMQKSLHLRGCLTPSSTNTQI